MRLRTIALLLAATALSAQTAADWLNRGVQAFKNGRFAEAVTAFQQAVDLDPGAPAARLYLATAYMQQYVPGATTPENLTFASNAAVEFQRALELEPANKIALASLASLNLNQKRYDAARDWYNRLLVVDPQDKAAYYSLAFLDWSQWYPAYSAARAKLGMRQADPGPLTDPGVRAELRSQWWSVIDDGIYNLNRALALDPQYADAMAYMNLFLRERGDLRDTSAECQRDVAEADQWVRKALDAKRAQAAGGPGGVAAPPPPPPPPPGASPQPAEFPQRIRVSGNVEAANLTYQPAPVYPPLAVQARIQGTVTLSVVIGRDGRVVNITVVSGHPLLVQAALDAVKQYAYRPTLLNGQPVEVVTEVAVNFNL